MNSPAPLCRSARAFTLIELLTVIAIIGILAAIIIPTVGKVRATARNAECVSRLRDWGRAIHLFANDNKGRYQGENWISAASNPYEPYLPKLKDNAGNTTGGAKFFGGCPLINQNPVSDFETSYAFVRPSIDGDIAKVQPNPPTDPVTGKKPNRFVPLNRAASPSNFLVMSDSMKGSSSTVDATQAQIDVFISPLFGAPIGDPAKRGDETFARRHGGTRINGLFGDASVKSINGKPAGSEDTSSIYEMRTTWFQLY